MSWKWPADVQAVQAFLELPKMLSPDPRTQDLLRRFLMSVAFKGDLKYLKLTDVIESSFAGKTPGALVGLDPAGSQELTLINPEDQGNNTFLALIDTPPSYAGASGQAVAVNTAEDGLEFVAFPSGGNEMVGGKMTDSGTTGLPSSGADQSPDFDTSEFDSGSVVDLSNDKLVIPEDGYYLLVFRCKIGGLSYTVV